MRRRALRADVKPPLDLVKSNCRASRAADSSVSRWMSIEDCNTQSFPSVCSFYLAALALGFAWLRCIVFLLCKFIPLQIRAISPATQREGCVGPGRRFGQIRMVENRATTGGRLVPLYTKSALDARYIIRRLRARRRALSAPEPRGRVVRPARARRVEHRVGGVDAGSRSRPRPSGGAPTPARTPPEFPVTPSAKPSVV